MVTTSVVIDFEKDKDTPQDVDSAVGIPKFWETISLLRSELKRTGRNRIFLDCDAGTCRLY